MIEKYYYNNQYNITIKELEIDYDNKTFRVGNFNMFNKGKKITRKEFYNRIDILIKNGFKEV